jgi:hypothetical protein
VRSAIVTTALLLLSGRAIAQDTTCADLSESVPEAIKFYVDGYMDGTYTTDSIWRMLLDREANPIFSKNIPRTSYIEELKRRCEAQPHRPLNNVMLEAYTAVGTSYPTPKD